MRITHALRCTNLIAKSAAGVAFWSVNLFASQASLDAYRASSTVLAADKAKATLLTTSVLSALGITNSVATTNPPGTVTLKDGTLGYGAHNLVRQSQTSASWTDTSSGTVTVSAGTGSTSPLTGAASDVWTASAANTPQRAASATTPLAQVTIIVAVRLVSGTGTITWFWGDQTGTLGTATGSWQILTATTTAGAAGNNRLDLRLVNSAVIEFGGAQVNYGPVRLDYVPTTSAAVYAPRITFDRGAGQNLLLQSENCDNAAYTVDRATISTERLTEDANSGTHRAFQSVTLTATEAFFSVDLRVGSRTWAYLRLDNGSDELAFFNLAAGTVGTVNAAYRASIAPVADGYFRCTIVRASPVAGTNYGVVGSSSGDTVSGYQGDGASYINVRRLHVGYGKGSPYLRTFATAPLYTAGTPRSQNLLPDSDPYHSPWYSDGAVTVGTTAGESRIQFSGANQGRGVVSTVAVGCAYSLVFDIKATQAGDAGTTINMLSVHNTSTLITLTAAYQTVTIRSASAVNGTITLHTYSGVTARDVTIRNIRLYEGTADLPYYPTTGTAYSEYPQAGLLREVARTNSIRNSTMVGAAAGSPGTLPTNWSTSDAGLTRTLAIGTDKGRPYVDIRWNGTTSGTSFWCTVDGLSIAAANGQTWTASLDAALVGGSLANTTAAKLHIFEYSAGSGYLTDSGTSLLLAPMLTRQVHTRALNNASTAFAATLLYITCASGAAIDLTIRVAAPQFELGAFPTSYIPTTTASVTRDADLIRPPTSYINDTAQTTVVEFNSAVPDTTVHCLVARTGSGFVAYLNNSYNALIYDGTNAAQVNPFTANISQRMATRYSSAGIGVSLNGAAPATSSFDGTMGTSAGTVAVGDNASGGNGFTGLITRISIASKAANDADLQAASAGTK